MYAVLSEVFVIISRTAESTMVHLLIAIDPEAAAAGRTLVLLDLADPRYLFLNLFLNGAGHYLLIFFYEIIDGALDAAREFCSFSFKFSEVCFGRSQFNAEFLGFSTLVFCFFDYRIDLLHIHKGDQSYEKCEKETKKPSRNCCAAYKQGYDHAEHDHKEKSINDPQCNECRLWFFFCKVPGRDRVILQIVFFKLERFCDTVSLTDSSFDLAVTFREVAQGVIDLSELLKVLCIFFRSVIKHFDDHLGIKRKAASLAGKDKSVHVIQISCCKHQSSEGEKIVWVLLQ